MGILTTNQKIRALLDIAMRLYNPEVMHTYTSQGESGDEGVVATKKTLRTHLTVKPDDTPIVALLRMFLYYFVCGRYLVATAPLTLYPIHKDRTRNHLHVYLKPVQKGKKVTRKDGRLGYAPYADFSIPHFVGNKNTKVVIPSYTVGGWTVKLTLKDKSFILQHFNTKEEGIEVITKLSKYVDPKYLPDGGVSEKTLQIGLPNDGKVYELSGIKIRAYKVEFYKFGEENWDWAQNIN
jgi:hypothetical protein